MKVWIKRILYGLLGLIVLGASAISIQFYILARQSEDMLNAGLTNGSLQDCPDRPSCVNSLSTDDIHEIAPFFYDGNPVNAMNRLAAVVSAMPRSEIRVQEDGYLHATFATAVFGFVDDVEFLLDGTDIQVRSVSRVGYGDMGVNRNRIEEIRREYMQE